MNKQTILTAILDRHLLGQPTLKQNHSLSSNSYNKDPPSISI